MSVHDSWKSFKPSLNNVSIFTDMARVADFNTAMMKLDAEIAATRRTLRIQRGEIECRPFPVNKKTLTE